ILPLALCSPLCLFCLLTSLFFFNDTATTEIYTLSLHDALPISAACPDPAPRHRLHRLPRWGSSSAGRAPRSQRGGRGFESLLLQDRKSTRLNSSHVKISYAVFCLKKKTKKTSKNEDDNTQHL